MNKRRRNTLQRATITYMIILFFISFLVILLLGFLLQMQLYGAEPYVFATGPEEKNAIEELLDKYDIDPKIRFRGDVEIKPDEEINGDIVLQQGTLWIKGKVDGSVLVINGDAELDSTARIDGRVLAINGKVWVKKGAVIAGDIMEMTDGELVEGEAPWYSQEDEENGDDRRYHDYPRYDDCDSFECQPIWIDYTRVDGLTLGMQKVEEYHRRHRHQVQLFGRAGYSFVRKEFQYRAGLKRYFGYSGSFALGAEFYDQTETEDRWIITDMENFLAASLIREDFRDYYHQQGFRLFLNNEFGRHSFVQFAYANEAFSDLGIKSRWSLFGGDKRFRSNPPALFRGFVSDDGDSVLNIRSWQGRLCIDSRNDRDFATRGIYFQAIAQMVTENLESDIAFGRYIADLRLYQSLGWHERLAFRLRVGTSTGMLPPMYWFELGGVSTLRGYEFKEFAGNRMVLANLEYSINTDGFFIDGLNLIFFVDSGHAWFVSGTDPRGHQEWPLQPTVMESSESLDITSGFDRLDWSSLHTNIGFALAGEDDDWRINFARRTDYDGADFVITFRLNQSF
ncbi:BamA/TamA family outer membrane protein [candidate division KSB1 bacterium]|nr:BamA/TamA family outer membrane protein [candidate division KSB1 bacterium]